MFMLMTNCLSQLYRVISSMQLSVGDASAMPLSRESVARQVAFPLRAGGSRENSARRQLADGMLANSAATSAAIKFPIHASGFGVVKTSVVADKVKAARSSSRRGL